MELLAIVPVLLYLAIVIYVVVKFTQACTAVMSIDETLKMLIAQKEGQSSLAERRTPPS